ncbi:MAG TPA: hypothetical protein VLH35_01280 [Candidatus Acidoferrales bacterium]|nr:hypothetical protein [Candidatus Acidoferrales bacterium]
MTYQKKSSKKGLIAITLIVILAVASGVTLYVYLSTVHVGVKVGDTFTYSLRGDVTLTAANATMDPGFEQYNQTDYFKVTITAIEGTRITLSSDWKFLNGTIVNFQQNIDLANGDKTDENGFWAIYASNLNKGELLRPKGADGQVVNNTDTAPYAGGTRSRCSWHIENEFYDYTDTTYSTLMYDIRNIFFDRETGMLLSLENYQLYNKPEKTQVIYWTLTDSSVWDV